MTTIFLCGKRSDNAVAQALTGALERYGQVQYFNGEVLKRNGSKSEKQFCIYDCEQLPRLELSEGILLLKNSFSSVVGLTVPVGVLAVLESRNQKAAAALKGTGLSAVVCGTSSRDTLSVASLTDTAAAVSLQRSVKTITGEVQEPGDISITLSHSIGPYSLLATCAVFLLAGIPPDDGYQF